jgi:mono/diheme cytochrome c family protein
LNCKAAVKTAILRWALAALVAGCAGESDDKGAVEQGKALFTRNGCAVCHGPDGRGDGQIATTLQPPPRDLRDPSAYKNGHSEAAIARTIQKGMPGTSMPGYGHLSAEDREQIAAYIRSLLENKENEDTP